MTNEYSKGYDEGYADAKRDIKGITPDGRPIHAWEAELSFAEQERQKAERRNKELDVYMAALKVREIHMHNEIHTGDTVIRLTMGDRIEYDNLPDAILSKV